MKPDISKTEVGHLAVRVQIANALYNDGILTAAKISRMSDAELLRVPGLGRKGIAELRAVVPAKASPATRQRRALDEIADDLRTLAASIDSTTPAWRMIEISQAIRAAADDIAHARKPRPKSAHAHRATR